MGALEDGAENWKRRWVVFCMATLLPFLKILATVAPLLTLLLLASLLVDPPWAVSSAKNGIGRQKINNATSACDINKEVKNLCINMIWMKILVR